ncbi:MAG: UDP-N-acetylmuramoyl-L-alanine--D-glutamate ligase [Gammaproteobacteria bacterium]|nr:UDP-N-acetylmuramoyl-L-alanine--D-glutamate ligase [Gammaproteobacteria bacterium]
MNTAESRRPRNTGSGLPATLVLGMGATGASCARYLSARGELAVFVDTRAAPPEVDAIRAAMPAATLHTGGDYELADSIETLVVSPGVPVDLPVLAKARDRGLRVVSDIDLFMQEASAPVAGITGSNGKSTVTAMLGDALRAAGWDTRCGGNLGTPALDLLDPLAEAYVLELSSFQLERSGRLRLDVAVLLNLSPDHLDSHTSLADYLAAKQRIYSACRHAVVNRDQCELMEKIPADTATTGFTLGEPASDDFGLRRKGNRDYLACGEALLLGVDELQVQGQHNLANALATLALGAALGADPQGMLNGLRRFTGLPHRNQLVTEARGISWIDDSKATNVGAAVASLRAITGPLVLIAGGDAKGGDFTALATALKHSDTRAIVLLGRDRELLATALDGIAELELADDMHTAVKAAAAHLPDGGTALLAPACSSLDMYSSYAARGEAFQAAVRRFTR